MTYAWDFGDGSGSSTNQNPTYQYAVIDSFLVTLIVADQYGFVHLFWFQSGGMDTRVRILYSRYDGEAWSTPNDVFVTMPLSVSSDLSADIAFSTVENVIELQRAGCLLISNIWASIHSGLYFSIDQLLFVTPYR